jgi:hypothetical protein
MGLHYHDHLLPLWKPSSIALALAHTSLARVAKDVLSYSARSTVSFSPFLPRTYNHVSIEAATAYLSSQPTMRFAHFYRCGV